MPPLKPLLPIPDPLDCSVPGSFAYLSIHDRLPTILDRILKDNNYSPGTRFALHSLRDDLFSGHVRPIEAGAFPDRNDWGLFTAPFLGQAWIDLPWFFAETYFYRRVLEAVRYFDRPLGDRHDPFLPQKKLSLESSFQSVTHFAERARTLSSQANPEGLKEMLLMDLWSNRADLSIWPSMGKNTPLFKYNQQNPLVIDDSVLLGQHLFQQTRSEIIDLVLDNAGLELIGDLCLASYFLETGLARQVRFHAKADPTFVSDTTAEDIFMVLSRLSKDADTSAARLGQSLQDHHTRGSFIVQNDSYWNTPLAGWEMPAALQEVLEHAALVIYKGDANYRRLVGDRRWPFTTPFASVCSYSSAPIACLRAIKSEVLTGFSPGEEEKLRSQNAKGFTLGIWGILQFLLPDDKLKYREE